MARQDDDGSDADEDEGWTDPSSPNQAASPSAHTGSNFPVGRGGSKALESVRSQLPPLDEGERLAKNYWCFVSFMFEPLEASQRRTERSRADECPAAGNRLLGGLLSASVHSRRRPWQQARLRLHYPRSWKPFRQERTLELQRDRQSLLPPLPDCSLRLPLPVSPRFLQRALLELTIGLASSNNTLAAAQTLQITSNFLFNRHDLQDSGETYFPLLGMAMRMIVTMGLHRDPSKWGMTGEEADRRRLLFHELLTLDRFQSLVTGRPYMLSPEHFDTEMATNACPYQTWKWKIGLYIVRRSLARRTLGMLG